MDGDVFCEFPDKVVTLPGAVRALVEYGGPVEDLEGVIHRGHVTGKELHQPWQVWLRPAWLLHCDPCGISRDVREGVARHWNVTVEVHH